MTIALPGCKNPSDALQGAKEILTLTGLGGDSAELENIGGKHFDVYALVDQGESHHFHNSPIRADGKCAVGKIGRSDHLDIGAMLL